MTLLWQRPEPDEDPIVATLKRSNRMRASHDVVDLYKRPHKVRWALAVATVTLIWMGPLLIRALADDVFQLAVNYVFTGE
jgi:hypothetical protein